MKVVFLLIAVFLIRSSSFGQNEIGKGQNVYITAGSVDFGTGDFVGYAVNVGYSKRLSLKKTYLSHFSADFELTFETGNKQPKVINPTPWEFIEKTYYSTTNIALFSKIDYHPLNKTFLRGFNIAAGIAVGYTNQNREFHATRVYDSVTQLSVRRSYLEYINQVIFGYRVTVGYEYPIAKHVLVGARADFENYTNLGDINAAISGKVAYSF
jgi:hypothetical protein